MKNWLAFTTLAVLDALICCAVGGVIGGCGVRGRPQPPLTPAEIGRGQPTFKRATEEFAFPDVPSPESAPESVSKTNSDAGAKIQKKPTPPKNDGN